MLQLVAMFSNQNMQIVLHVPTYRTNLTSMLQTSHHPVVIVADVECQENENLLHQVKSKIKNIQHVHNHLVHFCSITFNKKKLWFLLSNHYFE